MKTSELCRSRLLLLTVLLLCGAQKIASEETTANIQEPAASTPTTSTADTAQNNDGFDNQFCQGMFMTMFTDGFRFSLTNSTTKPCLAYYVSTWRLNESGKFRGACVFSFLLALLTEGLSATRFVLIEYLHTHQNSKQRKFLLTFIYGLQGWMGTMIMLVAMMYSIELLVSVVAGLMVGNYLFNREHPQREVTSRGVNTINSRIRNATQHSVLNNTRIASNHEE